MLKLIRWIFIFFIGNTWSLEPSLNWKTLESEHFYIHFSENDEALAKETANKAEQIHRQLKKQLLWEPDEKTHLILSDHTDVANGYATPFPFNRSVLFVHPPEAGAMDFHSWLSMLITHEYTHILHLDQTEGAPKFLRRIFGRHGLLFPNAYQPSWLIEGFATYKETDFEKRIGRGQSTLFKMMMQEEVEHGFKSIDEINMSSPSWPLNARYLYGYYFFEFLESEFGNEKVQQYISNYGDNIFPFLLNTNANNVIGKDMTELWQAFNIYLKTKFQNDTHLHLRNLTKDGFFKSDIASDGKGAVYWSGYDGYHEPRLSRINKDESIEHLIELNSLASLDYHSSNGVLIAQPEVCDEYNLYFDLYIFMPETNSLNRLTHCSRYSEAIWSKNGKFIYALKAESGKFQIDQLDSSGKHLKMIWKSPDLRVVSGIDIDSKNEKLIASVQRVDENRANIEEFAIVNKRWRKVISDKANQRYASFISDDVIRFSSDRSGRYQLYDFDMADNRLYLLNAFTNASLFQHDVLNEKVYSLEYTAYGYEIVKYSPVKQVVNFQNNIGQNEITIKPEAKISYDKNKPLKISDYSPLKTLKPTYWTPFAIGNDNTLEIGASTNGQDALENHYYQVAASIELERYLPNILMSYQYDHSFRLSLSHYHDINDDDIDSTSDFVEQNTDVLMSYSFPISSIQSRWNFELAIGSDTERQYLWYQDDLLFIRDTNEILGGLRIAYDSTNHYLRSISISDGRQVKFAVGTGDLFDSDFLGNKALVDWREFFQLYKENVLALRFLAGSGELDTKPFRAGGNFSAPYFISSNSFIEDRYAFRGYPDFSDFLTGRHLRLFSAEWRFPIWHIERTLMSPPVGIEEVSGKFFYDKARVYGHRDAVVNAYPSINLRDREYESRGVEILSQFRLFYYLPINVRLGYAEALDPLIGGEEVYVSIGTSF
ncbi:hypothetical protein [Pleionea sediminis]|uniref:hypothetical protein n=1 Tax=Pleionea sediminis TaxID=2569479 RepID=UPI00118502AF|nr:hypothetical protein [Pleionea sediminis]